MTMTSSFMSTIAMLDVASASLRTSVVLITASCVGFVRHDGRARRRRVAPVKDPGPPRPADPRTDQGVRRGDANGVGAMVWTINWLLVEDLPLSVLRGGRPNPCIPVHLR